jgi:hypothetical protein
MSWSESQEGSARSARDTTLAAELQQTLTRPWSGVWRGGSSSADASRDSSSSPLGGQANGADGDENGGAAQGRQMLGAGADEDAERLPPRGGAEAGAEAGEGAGQRGGSHDAAKLRVLHDLLSASLQAQADGTIDGDAGGVIRPASVRSRSSLAEAPCALPVGGSSGDVPVSVSSSEPSTNLSSSQPSRHLSFQSTPLPLEAREVSTVCSFDLPSPVPPNRSELVADFEDEGQLGDSSAFQRQLLSNEGEEGRGGSGGSDVQVRDEDEKVLES